MLIASLILRKYSLAMCKLRDYTVDVVYYGGRPVTDVPISRHEVRQQRDLRHRYYTVLWLLIKQILSRECVASNSLGLNIGKRHEEATGEDMSRWLWKRAASDWDVVPSNVQNRVKEGAHQCNF